MLIRLLDAGRLLVSDLDLDAVLDRVLAAAAEITGARYAAIGILDERREGLERFLTLGIDAATRDAIGEPPTGRGILGALIDDPRPLRLEELSADPRSHGFPDGHPPMHTFLGVPIVIAGEAWGNLYLTEKDRGDPFTKADEEAAAVLAGWAAIAIANARVFAASEQRRDELEHAVRRLEATTAVARAVGTETDLERVLGLIASRARALVDARGIAILLREPEGLEVAAVAGELPEGMSTHPSLDALGDEWLFVPLTFHGRALGMLAALEPHGSRPEAEDAVLLESFAASAATAVATARSVEEQRVRDMVHAAEEERRRWARELHDGPLQHFGALRMRLLAARRSADADGLREAIDDVAAKLQFGIGELRGLVRELRPAALDELGPAAAIEGLVQRVGERFGLEVRTDVQLDGARRHAPELETTLYRLVEEALVNAARHSDARTVWVTVELVDGVVRLEIRDDGRGFDPAAPRSGYGLAGMEQRVALLRGELAVESSEAGTRLTAAFPLNAAARSGRAAEQPSS